MTVTVGINGFGRIGRNILRAILESGRTDIKVVAINDLTPVDNSAYLFKYDSVHKVFAGDVSHSDGAIIIDGTTIPVTAERDPSKLDWGHVDIALECTGFFQRRGQGTNVHHRWRKTCAGFCPWQRRG